MNNKVELTQEQRERFTPEELEKVEDAIMALEVSRNVYGDKANSEYNICMAIWMIDDLKSITDYDKGMLVSNATALLKMGKIPRKMQNH